MYTPLGEEKLKNGETLEIGVVLGPDAEWQRRLVPFLGHKGPDYSAHIRRSLEAPLDALQTRFYVGRIGEELAAQIMIVGDRGAGILGHVFTRPEHRRKGACGQVMRHQMEDCRRQGFRALCLGTGYDSPPYWIYHSFGFRGLAEGTGRMKWTAEPGAEAELFRPAASSIRDVRWDDWGYFDLLAYEPVLPNEELPRCTALGLKGQDSVEGPFAAFQFRREREPRIQARALVSEHGATVGWAFLSPDLRWFRDAWLLDLHTHPNFASRLPELLASVELPHDAPVAAYTTTPQGPKAAALLGAGLRATALLPAWLSDSAERRDLQIWTR